MTTPARFLLLLANGFVAYYYWNEHKLGMSVGRTVLLLFVIPACITDRDLRGLHDRAANTIVVRM